MTSEGGSVSGSNVLVVAPHPDDEILGAGGTIAKYSAQGREVTVLTVSGHLPPLYPQEAYSRTVREAEAAHKLVGVSEAISLEIPATFVHREAIHELNARIYSVIDDKRPSVVLCPYPDRHIDHQAVFEAVMVASRPVRAGSDIELLAAYETPSETQWNAPHIEPNFTPNWVVDISDQIETKIEAFQCFESQISEPYGSRSVEAVRAMAIFRGSQSGFPYGEGFHVIRMRS